MRVVGDARNRAHHLFRKQQETRHSWMSSFLVHTDAYKEHEQSRQKESTFYIAAKNEIRRILRYIDLYLETQKMLTCFLLFCIFREL